MHDLFGQGISKKQIGLIISFLILGIALPQLLPGFSQGLTKPGGELEAGSRRVFQITPEVEIAMRWIPPGTFQMGSPQEEQGHVEEESQHQVTLTKGYWLA